MTKLDSDVLRDATALCQLGYEFAPLKFLPIRYEQATSQGVYEIVFDVRDKRVIKRAFDGRGKGESPLTFDEAVAVADVLMKYEARK